MLKEYTKVFKLSWNQFYWASDEPNCYASFHVSKITDVQYNGEEKSCFGIITAGATWKKKITWNFLKHIWEQLEISQEGHFSLILGHPVVVWD